ncbi:Aste57867_22572 [Aphanomyces stellatus]|uniref:Aste57867_22572 protein n=1 Tax=Aphanomyces stellatus TaxID=120398 RepID=A0A485LM39_9STRA|nr:hypothetical protein As57867_022502 [Aphanomyces stellatus]VFT99230.1 Aste57867_22572 [Aphanomyces stellatus]
MAAPKVKHNFVPCAIIERASVDSMLYVACPTCRRAIHTRDANQKFFCYSCQLSIEPENTVFSFKLAVPSESVLYVALHPCLEMRCAIGLTYLDVILFNEVVEAFLGCFATHYYHFVQKWDSFPQHLASVLEGMHVSLTLRPPPPSQDPNLFKRDPKVLAIEPLVRISTGPLMNDVIAIAENEEA